MHPEQANRQSNEKSMPKSDSQIAAKGKHRQQKPTKYCQKTNDNNILDKQVTKKDKHMTTKMQNKTTKNDKKMTKK